MTSFSTLRGRTRRALGVTSLATLLAAGALTAAGPAGATPAAAPTTDKLYTTQVLTGGHSLVSNNGAEYQLLMQTDGNLVMYAVGRALWSTGTAHHPGARVTVQTDGNIVVYSSTNQPLWQNHQQFPGGSYLQMEDGGSLVQLDSHGTPRWEVHPQNGVLLSGHRLMPNWSLTVSGSNYLSLTMQPDGNLVNRDGNVALWTTQTNGNPGAYLIMQTDGNLVVYSTAGKPLWNTRTSGHPGAYFTIRDSDDDLIVAAPGGRVLWSTQTGRVG